MSDEWIDVRRAAALLGVQPVRVRQLIADRRLVADRWANRWRIDRDSVDRLRAQERIGGRPYAPAVAWWALGLLDPDLRPRPVGRHQEARSVGYARNIADGRIGGLRHRAAVVRGRVHPSLLADLGRELVRSGVDGLPEASADRVVDDSVLEGYVPLSRWARLVDDFAIDDDGEPNVIAHLVADELWPFAPRAELAGPVVAAVDLLERGGERLARAARSVLNQVEITG